MAAAKAEEDAERPREGASEEAARTGTADRGYHLVT